MHPVLAMRPRTTLSPTMALRDGKPYLYPQDDDAHHAKLGAFLDWLDAPSSLRDFHRAWNGASTRPLPAADAGAWAGCIRAARNALLPNLTAFGMALGFVVSGALLTEIVFSYPGQGYLLAEPMSENAFIRFLSDSSPASDASDHPSGLASHH